MIGALIAGVISGTLNAVNTVRNGGGFLDGLGAFVGGFITGGVIGAAAILGGGLAGAIVGGAVAGAIGGAITGFAFSVASQGISNGFDNIDWQQVGYDALFGAVSGAIAGSALGMLKSVVSSKVIASSIAQINQGGAKFYDSLKNTLKVSSILKNGFPHLVYSQRFYYIAELAINGIYSIWKSIFKGIVNQIIKGANR